jgi:hypothetical protein
MAPEKVCSFIVLDLESTAGSLTATRYTAPVGPRFLLKWVPLKDSPRGYKPIAGGVIHVPEPVVVDKPEHVELGRVGEPFRYKDYADILIARVPRGTQLDHLEPAPAEAKVHDHHLAAYWLASADGEINVKWSTVSSDADPAAIARAINAKVSKDGPLPRLSLDDCEIYDVALSYASEDRAHAEPLARALRKAGCHIFYDDEANLWGEDLALELPAIYQHRARFCLPLVSASYAAKMWTNVERRAALARAAEQPGRAYVLPIRIDGTDLEGLPPSIVYRLISEGPEQLAAQVMKKLSSTPRRL